MNNPEIPESRLQAMDYVQMTVEEIKDGHQNPDDDWGSIAIAHSDEENIVLGFDPQLFATPESKDRLKDILSQLIREKNIHTFVLVLSAWSVVHKHVPGTNPEEPGHLPPSEDPNRQEVLIITGLDAEGVSSRSAEIERFEDKPPSLGEWKDASDVSGRFVESFLDALKGVRNASQ